MTVPSAAVDPPISKFFGTSKSSRPSRNRPVGPVPAEPPIPKFFGTPKPYRPTRPNRTADPSIFRNAETVACDPGPTPKLSASVQQTKTNREALPELPSSAGTAEPPKPRNTPMAPIPPTDTENFGFGSTDLANRDATPANDEPVPSPTGAAEEIPGIAKISQNIENLAKPRPLRRTREP